MTDTASLRARLEGVRAPSAGAARDLTIGAWRIRFECLDDALASTLEARWGGFLAPPAGSEPTRRVVVVETSDVPAWTPHAPGEGYRLEATFDGGPALVRSYAFAMTRRSGGEWLLGLAAGAIEPRGRTMDNAARWLAADLAAGAGGLALHGAGAAIGGRAWIFAGPSRSGKSTASRRAAPAASLGDDFAIVVPTSTGWGVPAVPFDNAETAPAAIARGLVPLGGILRVFQAPAERLERPAAPLANASLMACAAFPWALADRIRDIERAADRLVEGGCFGHLHFALERDFTHLLRDPR